MDFESLDSKLYKLKEDIDTASHPIFGHTPKEKWDNLIELVEEIFEDFKNVRYPKKIQRDEAWQRFYKLRNLAYRKKREAFEDLSKEHYKELMGILHNAYYDALSDGFAQTIHLFEVTVEEMKQNAKRLNEAGGLFKSYKNEMTRDHKAEVHERIVEVRESHDQFWERYREYREEKNKIREEKKQAWEEKKERSRAIKQRIEDNLEKNRERLEKATEFLKRLEEQRDDLREKIDEAWSDSYRERHEEWLEEKENKIKEVEEQISKYEDWISEDEQKLRDWVD